MIIIITAFFRNQLISIQRELLVEHKWDFWMMFYWCTSKFTDSIRCTLQIEVNPTGFSIISETYVATPTLDSTSANDVLRQISEQSADHKHEFLSHQSQIRVESDDESEAESPIFDSFCSTGWTEAITKTINFTATETTRTWSELEQDSAQKWNIERGHEPSFKSRSVTLHGNGVYEATRLLGSCW